MITLIWVSDDKDIVTYTYRPEDGDEGVVMYSRTRKAIRMDSTPLVDYPKLYKNHMKSVLIDFAKKDKFPKEYTIAWY